MLKTENPKTNPSEHGQWWVTDRDTGAQWSVMDTAGHPSVDGFDFAQVTPDEED